MDMESTDQPVDNSWREYIPIVTSFLRTLMTAGGAFGITWASTVSADKIELWGSTICLVGGAAWSLWQKISSIRVLRKQARLNGNPVPKLPM